MHSFSCLTFGSKMMLLHTTRQEAEPTMCVCAGLEDVVFHAFSLPNDPPDPLFCGNNLCHSVFFRSLPRLKNQSLPRKRKTRVKRVQKEGRRWGKKTNASQRYRETRGSMHALGRIERRDKRQMKWRGREMQSSAPSAQYKDEKDESGVSVKRREQETGNFLKVKWNRRRGDG